MSERDIDIANVDVTVIAQAPRLAPHPEAMREAARRWRWRRPPTRSSVKAKSTDGLGAVGRGEGIAAQASRAPPLDG